MCSLFEMENYQEGDLTDIVRGSRSSINSEHWQFSSQQQEASASASASAAAGSRISILSSPRHHLLLEDQDQYNFGDPFCASASMTDPLLHDLDFIGNYMLITCI